MQTVQQLLARPKTHEIQGLIGPFDKHWLRKELELLDIPDYFFCKDGMEHHSYVNFRPCRSAGAVKWQSRDLLGNMKIGSILSEFPMQAEFTDFTRTVIRALHILRRQQRKVGPIVLQDNGSANVFRCVGCEVYINFFCDGGKWVVDASRNSVDYCTEGDRFFFPG